MSLSASSVSRRSLLRAGGMTVSAGAITSVLAACTSTRTDDSSSSSSSGGSLTFRLWDEGAASAYEEALTSFTEDTGIEVKIEQVAWSDYFTTLRNDIAAGSAPDVFWVNASNYVDYAAAGKLLDIEKTFPESERTGWLEAAMDQYTVDGNLWGVPAMTDPNIAVYYNKELLDAAGVSVEDLADLAWDPTAESDTLREIATKLTLDKAGKTPADDGFDSGNIVQFGYNAASDLQAIYLPWLGANGATYQDDDGQMSFASDAGIETFQYIVDLINEDHVSPSAADTNTNGDFSRDQFIQGKMGLFQSGAYNLANIKDGADFEWGIVELPQGPKGRGGVVSAVAAVGSAASTSTDAQKKLLAWIGSADGSKVLGEKGVGLPGNTDAQDSWKTYWTDQDVDVTPMMTIDPDTSLPGPWGAKIQAAMDATNKVLPSVFLGKKDVAEGLKEAQDAGNAAIDG